MNTLIYQNYNDIRKNIWDNEILNHYINNFTQHIYYTDSKKWRNKLSVFLVKIKQDLENKRSKNILYKYLQINYNKNNVSDSVKIISEFYEN